MRNINEIKTRLAAYENAYKEISKEKFTYANCRRLKYKINELRWVLEKEKLQ